jgi:hypothetical protein
MQHITPEIKTTITGSSTNTDVVVISGGMTSQLQVLDVVVNKPFKDHLKQLFSEWLLTGDHTLTPDGRIKKNSATLLCQWSTTAWQHISTEVTVNDFKKCFISNITNWTDDNMLQNGSEEDRNVSSECEEDEGTECTGGDSDTDR